MISVTSVFDRFGFIDRIKAAIALACGAAIDVPLSVPVRLFGKVDRISFPGATTSNSFPYEEKFELRLLLLLDEPTIRALGKILPG